MTSGLAAARSTAAPDTYAACAGEMRVNPDDLSDFITCFFSTPPCSLADFDFSGAVTPDDLSNYITVFFAGCPRA